MNNCLNYVLCVHFTLITIKRIFVTFSNKRCLPFLSQSHLQLKNSTKLSWVLNNIHGLCLIDSFSINFKHVLSHRLHYIIDAMISLLVHYRHFKYLYITMPLSVTLNVILKEYYWFKNYYQIFRKMDFLVSCFCVSGANYIVSLFHKRYRVPSFSLVNKWPYTNQKLDKTKIFVTE